jgi:hypothetical protein
LSIRLTTAPQKYIRLRNHGGDHDPHRVVDPVEEEKKVVVVVEEMLST